MASALRMMMIGILWLVSMIVLVFLAYLGGTFQKIMNDFLMQWSLLPMLREGAGTIWWIGGLYYITILIMAIAITYRCYQATIEVTDYFPDLGVYR